MSKNNDRYKEDYTNIDIEELDEIETQKFQKFRPKKKQSVKAKNKNKEKGRGIRILVFFMQSFDDKCVGYLDMFRDELYQELRNKLKQEDPHTVVTFCYYLARYEGPHHLHFLRQLMS